MGTSTRSRRQNAVCDCFGEATVTILLGHEGREVLVGVKGALASLAGCAALDAHCAPHAGLRKGWCRKFCARELELEGVTFREQKGVFLG